MRTIIWLGLVVTLLVVMVGVNRLSEVMGDALDADPTFEHAPEQISESACEITADPAGGADAVVDQQGALLDHDHYQKSDAVHVHDFTALHPSVDPMEQLWKHVTTEELHLYAALAREGIPRTPHIDALLFLHRQGADEDQLLAYINTHFSALPQMPYRAATLNWLLHLHPTLVSRQVLSSPQPNKRMRVLDTIQSVHSK